MKKYLLFTALFLAQSFLAGDVHSGWVYFSKTYEPVFYQAGAKHGKLDVKVKISGPEPFGIGIESTKRFTIEIIPDGYRTDSSGGASVPYLKGQHFVLVIPDCGVELLRFPEQYGYSVLRKEWVPVKPLSVHQERDYSVAAEVIIWFLKMIPGSAELLGKLVASALDFSDATVSLGKSPGKDFNEIDTWNRYKVLVIKTPHKGMDIFSAWKIVIDLKYGPDMPHLGFFFTTTFSRFNYPAAIPPKASILNRAIWIKTGMSRERFEVIRDLKYALGLEKLVFKNENSIKKRDNVLNIYRTGFVNDFANRLTDYSWDKKYNSLRYTHSALDMPDYVHVMDISRRTAVVYHENTPYMREFWDMKKYKIVTLIREDNKWKVAKTRNVEEIPAR